MVCSEKNKEDRAVFCSSVGEDGCSAKDASAEVSVSKGVNTHDNLIYRLISYHQETTHFSIWPNHLASTRNQRRHPVDLVAGLESPLTPAPEQRERKS